MSIPTDNKLYSRVKSRIYKKYPVHSAYRSGLLVKAYKKEFARLKKPGSPYKGKKPPTGLSRWFREKWRSDTGKVGYTSKSSVYRPTRRITRSTPTTFSELTPSQIKEAKKEKASSGRVKRFKSYRLQKFPDSKKKFKIILPNGKSVKFGARGYSDYTIHKDPERMKRYLARHKTREDWTRGGLDTAGFWSRWILWSKPSLSGAIKYTSDKFGIKIIENSKKD